MERFVQAVVAGGIALVAGLWLTTLTQALSPPWMAGGGLTVLGIAGLVFGLWLVVDI